MQRAGYPVAEVARLALSIVRLIVADVANPGGSFHIVAASHVLTLSNSGLELQPFILCLCLQSKARHGAIKKRLSRQRLSLGRLLQIKRFGCSLKSYLQRLSFRHFGNSFTRRFRCLDHAACLQGKPTEKQQHNSNRQDVPQKMIKKFFSCVSIAVLIHEIRLIPVEVHDLVFRQLIGSKLP